MVVYLLTTGDGSDGHEWQLHGGAASGKNMEDTSCLGKRGSSERAGGDDPGPLTLGLLLHLLRADGSTYRDFANEVEAWMVQDRYDAEDDAKKDTPVEVRS